MKQKELPVCFISYSNLDRNIAEKIATTLVNLGIDVWYDKWRIKAADSILDSVHSALNNCHVFLVLLSENALRSRWVKTECQAVLHRRLRPGSSKPPKIIPVLLGNCELPEIFRDILAIRYRPRSTVFVSELLAAVAAGANLDPNPHVCFHSRTEFFNKAIGVLRLQPKVLRTTLVGPIFLNSETMVQAKQKSDKEARPSFSAATRSFLLQQQEKPTCDAQIVIKLNARYERILKDIACVLDIKREILRMREELDKFIPSRKGARTQFAVCRDFSYSFFVTDRILIEAGRYSGSEKMEHGWSTTQPAQIHQKAEMFDKAFRKLFKGNKAAKAELDEYLKSLFVETNI